MDLPTTIFVAGAALESNGQAFLPGIAMSEIERTE
jgi:hypothetical protein